MEDLIITVNASTEADICRHLEECDQDFQPPLRNRVSIPEYSAKLFTSATRVEAWRSTRLIGLACFYLDDPPRMGFLSSLSVSPDYQGLGAGRALVERVETLVLAGGADELELEVSRLNVRAQGFYNALGFTGKASIRSRETMGKRLLRGPEGS